MKAINADDQEISAEQFTYEDTSIAVYGEDGWFIHSPYGDLLPIEDGDWIVSDEPFVVKDKDIMRWIFLNYGGKRLAVSLLLTR